MSRASASISFARRSSSWMKAPEFSDTKDCHRLWISSSLVAVPAAMMMRAMLLA